MIRRWRNAIRLAALTAAIGALPAADGDILRLRDGSRYHGEVLDEQADPVVFRVSRPDGRRQERRFPRALIDSITPGAIEPADPQRDALQRLTEGLELLRDQREKLAIRAFQRVVRDAEGDTLAACEALVMARAGAPLAELMADIRIRLARERDPDGVLDIKYATTYEADALGTRLRTLQAQTLETRRDGRRLADWVADRAAYDALKPEARELARDARLVAALIAARLKYDPALKRDRDGRVHAVRLRDDLARLVSHVRALPGFTALDHADQAGDPTLAEAERLRMLAARAAAEEEAEREQVGPPAETETPKPEPNAPTPE